MTNPIEAIWNLLFKDGEAEKYNEDPEQYLAETGLDHCDPAELHDLVVMAYEKGPVNQGATVSVGGNQSVGVDEQLGRLLVTGLWGLEVFDLRSRKPVARVRLPFGPRQPVIDAERDLVYVPSTFGNDVMVLDRRSLAPRGRLTVGHGGRNAYLSASAGRFFASGGGHAYAWDARELGRRFRPSS